MPNSRKASVALWVVQGLLAALFLFAGGMKLVMPAEMLKGPVPLGVAVIVAGNALAHTVGEFTLTVGLAFNILHLSR